MKFVSAGAIAVIAAAAMAASLSVRAADDSADDSNGAPLTCPRDLPQPIPKAHAPLQDPGMQLFYSPSDNPPPAGSPAPVEGHARWIQGIESATQSVHLTIYHLTDPQVIDALIAEQAKLEKTEGAIQPGDLAHGVHVILDPTFYKDPKNQAILAKLAAGHVSVQPGDAAFSITHEKSMVLDGKTAFVTSMNLTGAEASTRDFGVITRDAKVVSGVDSIFEFDWTHLATNTNPKSPQEPKLPAASPLVVSPVNSEARLLELINSAHRTLQCTTESLTDQTIMHAFECARQRGVNVQFISPELDEAPPACMNWAPESAMNAAAGSEIARLMPGAGTASQGGKAGVPYMHSKMCLVDYNTQTGGTAFVGSVNLSNDSTHAARELGITFQNPAAGAQISGIFARDWAQTVAVPDDGVKQQLCPGKPAAPTGDTTEGQQPPGGKAN